MIFKDGSSCLCRPSLVVQTVKTPPAMQETWVQFLGQEDPLEKGMATLSPSLAWRILIDRELAGYKSMGSQRVGHDWATNSFFHISCLYRPSSPFLSASCPHFVYYLVSQILGPWKLHFPVRLSSCLLLRSAHGRYRWETKAEEEGKQTSSWLQDVSPALAGSLMFQQPSEVLIQLPAPALLLEMAGLASLATALGSSHRGICGLFNSRRVF